MSNITEYTRDDHGLYIIPDGAEHWSQLLRENLTLLAGKIADGKVEGFEELRALVDQLQKDLEDRVRQDAFAYSQAQQDYNITALQQAMDTGFSGTSVVHTFAPAQVGHWQGWDGGLPEGSINSLNQLTN